MPRISDYKLINSERKREAYDQILASFNNTAVSFPDVTFNDLFQEIIGKYGDHVAIDMPTDLSDVYGTLTYDTLDRESNRVANFLIAQGVKNEQIVGVLMDATPAMITAIVGIMKSGAAFLPIFTGESLERIAYILNDAKAPVVIAHKKYLTTVNKLQWRCEHFNLYLLIDSDSTTMSDQELNSALKQDLWDLVGDRAHDDITGGGWVSSFTGLPFSREIMDEYGDNILSKLRPYLRPDSRVLEIGCSTGISMFRLAPLVGEYVGTDISETILNWSRAKRDRLSINNIQLVRLAAHEIDKLNVGEFDVVIMNSVVQNFGDHGYLVDVLRKVIQSLKSDGIVFLGDINDQNAYAEMLASLRKFKIENSDKNYTTKTDWSNELFLSKDFINELQFVFPEINSITFSDKVFTVDCELTSFRFDALLTIKKAAQPDVTALKAKRRKNQFSCVDLHQVTANPPAVTVQPHYVACVLYNAVSSKGPRGVMIEHRSLVNYLLWANLFYLKEREVFNFPLFTSAAIDLSITSIFCPLASGGQIYTYGSDLGVSAVLLDIFTNTNSKTSIVKLLPSHISVIKGKVFPSNKIGRVIVAGEEISQRHIDVLRQINSSITIFSENGSAETTGGCIAKLVLENKNTDVSLGSPIANSQCYVLNASLDPLPIGMVGELYVSGAALARGYLNDESGTNDKFSIASSWGNRRIYKTGINARWNSAGEIIYVSRKQNTFNINGHHIDPTEIEQMLKKLPGVGDVHVALWGEQDVTSLVAYYTKQSAVTTKILREYLLETLPLFMVPTNFICLPSLPVLPDGTINRKALPSPVQDVTPLLNSIARSDAERKLMKIWREILGVNSIGLQDNFFDLGGHSLRAVVMASRIQKEFNVEVELSDIFTTPNIGALAKKLSDTEAKPLYEIPLASPQEFYDLSYAQYGTWIQCQLDPKLTIFNMPGSFILNGQLNADVFRQSVRKLVERHESLRTSFVEVDCMPKQKIHAIEDVAIAVNFRNLEHEPNPLLCAQEFANEEAQRQIDLSVAPLFRISILKLSENKYFVAYTTHHIVSDGWSSLVLLNDFLGIYNALADGNEISMKPLNIQYKDFSSWQNDQLASGRFDQQKAYWLEKFSKPTSLLQLPTNFDVPAHHDFSGAELDVLFDEALSQDVWSFCKEKAVTLFMMLLSGVYALLHRYTRQNDLTIGTPIAGRFHPDLENQIGFYLNALALRVGVDHDETPNTLLEKVRTIALEGFENQHYPYELMLNDLKVERVNSNYSLFNVLIMLNNFDLVELNGLEMQGITVEDFKTNNSSSKFDLSFIFDERKDCILLRFEYKTCLFKEQTIARIGEDLKNVLRSFVNAPTVPIKTMDVMLDLDRDSHEVVSDFTQSINTLRETV